MAQIAWQIWIKKSLFFFQAKNFLNVLGLLCRLEAIVIFIILPSKKLFRYTGFLTVPEWNKGLWLISKLYKKQFLRLVKIFYFCLGWVKILMTPLLLDFRSLDIILESTIEELFFLAKFTFIKIAKKSCKGKICCMACTAPDAHNQNCNPI